MPLLVAMGVRAFSSYLPAGFTLPRTPLLLSLPISGSWPAMVWMDGGQLHGVKENAVKVGMGGRMSVAAAGCTGQGLRQSAVSG